MAALKKALAKAEDKAAKECAAREKHEAQVGEAQQQLQGAIERFESLERVVRRKSPNWRRPARVHMMHEPKPRTPSRKFRRPRRLRRVILSPCKASM